VVNLTFTFYKIILIVWKTRTAVSELRSEKHLELISSNIRKTTRVCSFFTSCKTQVEVEWNMDKLTYQIHGSRTVRVSCNSLPVCSRKVRYYVYCVTGHHPDPESDDLHTTLFLTLSNRVVTMCCVHHLLQH
jgi:hypothetical protein